MKKLHAYAIAAYSEHTNGWYLVAGSFDYELAGVRIILRRFKRNIANGSMNPQKLRVVKLKEVRER